MTSLSYTYSQLSPTSTYKSMAFGQLMPEFAHVGMAQWHDWLSRKLRSAAVQPSEPFTKVHHPSIWVHLHIWLATEYFWFKVCLPICRAMPIGIVGAHLYWWQLPMCKFMVGIPWDVRVFQVGKILGKKCLDQLRWPKRASVVALGSRVRDILLCAKVKSEQYFASSSLPSAFPWRCMIITYYRNIP